MRSLVHVSPLAFCLIAACGADAPPPPAEPDGGAVMTAPLAHVEIHTPDDELIERRLDELDDEETALSSLQALGNG